MNVNVERNRYRINKLDGTAIFELRNKSGNAISEFIVDVEDLDVFTSYTWSRSISVSVNAASEGIYGSHGESVTRILGAKYTYADKKMRVNRS